MGVPWEMVWVWCQPCRAGKEKALPAGEVGSPWTRGLSPPTLPRSVPAFCSLLAGFGAGFGLVFPSRHLPLRHPQRPPMRHPIPCYEPAPWMGGDGESPAAWDGTQAAPATHPRERGLVTSMSPCPWRSTLSLRSKCHPGPANASPSALQLPSPCHQRSRKKTSKNLPASAMQRLPFASAEVYWRSQHRALGVDGYMCAHL